MINIKIYLQASLLLLFLFLLRLNLDSIVKFCVANTTNIFALFLRHKISFSVLALPLYDGNYVCREEKRKKKNEILMKKNYCFPRSTLSRSRIFFLVFIPRGTISFWIIELLIAALKSYSCSFFEWTMLEAKAFMHEWMNEWKTPSNIMKIYWFSSMLYVIINFPYACNSWRRLLKGDAMDVR